VADVGEGYDVGRGLATIDASSQRELGLRSRILYAVSVFTRLSIEMPMF
jgi:hypothetical protein